MPVDVSSNFLVRCNTQGFIFFYLISPTFLIDPLHFPVANKAHELTSRSHPPTWYYMDPELASRPGKTGSEGYR